MPDPMAAGREVEQVLRAVAAAIVVLGTSGTLHSGSRAQAQLTQSVGEIQRIEAGGIEYAPRFRVVDVSPDVASVWIRSVTVPSSGLNVDVSVFFSAQQGTVYLSAAQPFLDLGVASSLTLWIGGNFGINGFSFASGTTLTQVAAAINWPLSGVHAIASGSGIVLRSDYFGSRAFVSVVAICEGGIQGPMTGLYQTQPDNAHAVDAATWRPIVGAGGAVDVGQDLYAEVNGEGIVGDGAMLRVDEPWLDADIWLRMGPAYGTANAQTIGTMRAFRVVRSP